jgi:hypothetical protein
MRRAVGLRAAWLVAFCIVAASGVVSAAPITLTPAAPPSFNAGMGVWCYFYQLNLGPGESITPNDLLSIFNATDLESQDVNGSAAQRFEVFPGFPSSNVAVWDALDPQPGPANPIGQFILYSTAPPGIVNWSYEGTNANGAGTVQGPVPEPSTLVLLPAGLAVFLLVRRRKAAGGRQ